MSAFDQYAAHAELNTAVNRNEDVAMLVEMHEGGQHPFVWEFPVSGDMLAVMARGSRYERTRRRERAAAGRAGR